MIRNYVRDINGREWKENLEIDFSAGTIRHYFTEKALGFVFDEHTATPEEWGWDSMEQFLKARLSRNRISAEVRHDLKRADEIGGLLRLAIYRDENGRQYDDVFERLANYGLHRDYINLIVRYAVDYKIERHEIRVTLPDGDEINTAINGTPEEIEKYYSGSTVFFYA